MDIQFLNNLLFCYLLYFIDYPSHSFPWNIMFLKDDWWVSRLLPTITRGVKAALVIQSISMSLLFCCVLCPCIYCSMGTGDIYQLARHWQQFTQQKDMSQEATYNSWNMWSVWFFCDLFMKVDVWAGEHGSERREPLFHTIDFLSVSLTQPTLQPHTQPCII